MSRYVFPNCFGPYFLARLLQRRVKQDDEWLWIMSHCCAAVFYPLEAPDSVWQRLAEFLHTHNSETAEFMAAAARLRQDLLASNKGRSVLVVNQWAIDRAGFHIGGVEFEWCDFPEFQELDALAVRLGFERLRPKDFTNALDLMRRNNPFELNEEWHSA